MPIRSTDNSRVAIPKQVAEAETKKAAETNKAAETPATSPTQYPKGFGPHPRGWIQNSSPNSKVQPKGHDETPKELTMEELLQHEKDGTLQQALGDTLPGKTGRFIGALTTTLRARMAIEGHIHLGKGPRYLEWGKENDRILAAATKGPAGEGVTGAAFTKRFEELAKAKFVGGNSSILLVDGPASFSQRYRLIEQAKTSIHLMTWKVYGDETGVKTVDALLAKKKANPAIDIKVMVDGNVATNDVKSAEQLARLVAAGIPVAFFHNDERPWEGQHYKCMTVDAGTPDAASIAGGMNIGDEYSHGYGCPIGESPQCQRWRDTDVLLQGPSVWEDEKTFAKAWNTMAGAKNKKDPFKQNLAKMELPKEPPATALGKKGDCKVMVTLDVPGPESENKVSQTMVAAIHASQKSVDIENAYVMDVPAIRESLVAAMKRGVQVRILTNSRDSIDQTVVSGPIQRGLKNILEGAEEAGVGDKCEIYVQNKVRKEVHNGDTLHSKFMVVDGELATVESYNMHGRSMRLEVEGAHWMQDKGFATSLREQFGKDIASASSTRLKTSADILLPNDRLSRLFGWLNPDPVIL